MAKGSDYRIKKVEKGPLQRFKNQNLLIKKFGEIGLQVYKAITGKRTTAELKKDLGIDPNLFDDVLTYMQDAGMVELEPVGAAKEAPSKEKAPAEEVEIPEVAPPEEEIIEPEKEKPEKKPPSLEELPEPEPEEEEISPLDEEPSFEGIEPIEMEDITEEKPEEEEPPEIEEELKPEEGTIEPVIEGEAPEEEPPPPEEPEPEPAGEIGFEIPEDAGPPPEEEGLSPVESIISDKYGDLGLQVYSLIDGQRTAEEIMSETGITEAKLVEILDFMDEQGIIKLDYPKGAGRPPPPPPTAPPAMGRRAAPPPAAKEKGEMGFVPMIDKEESLEEAKGIPSPLEIPVKAPLDIVKSVQMKAKVMLKLGDKGSKVLEEIDGRNDLIDISLKLELPLYEVADILRFMLENGVIIMKAMGRSGVRKKYGDDGYSVYKRYGKEGLMLYELIGKELTIRQMADKITKDRSEIIDMFIFIHQVLGIELPIDKTVLQKQLEI